MESPPSKHSSTHTHYQHVSETMYPETRKRLAALHAVRSQQDYSTAGWVVGAEFRATQEPSPTSSPVATQAPIVSED